MKSTILTISTLFIFISQLYSIGQEWAVRHNGTGNSSDFAYAIAFDPSGNIVVTGYSTNAGTSKDLMTIKYDTQGNVLWTASFNGPINGGDYSNALTIDASGNVYITGRADYGTTWSDIVTIKYNSQGVQQWMARFSGAANYLDEGTIIVTDNSGNVYVGGKSTLSGTDLDMVVLKYSPAGTLLWSKYYEGAATSDDYVAKLDLDAAGNIYAAGGSGGASLSLDLTVLKIDPAGNMIWVKTFNGSGNGGDAAVGVKVDAGGNIVACGYTDSGAPDRYNFLAIKYNPSGDVLWTRQFNGTSSHNDIATSMTVDQNSNVYMTGLSVNIIGTRVDSNYITLKYNSSGTFQWSAIYDGPNSSIDVSRSVYVDAAGDVYICGSSRGAGSDDFATIKYNNAGVSKWIMRYNGPGNQGDYGSSLIADNSGNVYVTGRSYGTGTDYDYATIKYSDLVGINPVSGIIPESFNLYQNYPNPFNPQTTVKFDIAERTPAELSVFNSLGKEVFKNNFGVINPGQFEYRFELSDLSTGAYFYRLTAGNFVQTRKMILIK
jgi:uncharacterized delta-60 repeat protein